MSYERCSVSQVSCPFNNTAPPWRWTQVKVKGFFSRSPHNFSYSKSKTFSLLIDVPLLVNRGYHRVLEMIHLNIRSYLFKLKLLTYPHSSLMVTTPDLKIFMHNKYHNCLDYLLSVLGIANKCYLNEWINVHKYKIHRSCLTE